MKIGVIGHFGGKKQFLDGQTVKTKEINAYIEKYYKIKTFKFDTYKNARNPFKLLYLINKTLKKNDIIIVILAIRGYKIITPLLMLINKIYKRRIFDIVIGGKRYNIYKNNNLITKTSRKYEKIFVETEKIKQEYEKRNLNNVEVLYNFKNLKKGKIKQPKENIKLCTFSRVIKEKGINDAIESIIKANKKLNKNVFELDIYGQLGEEYKQEFESIIKNSPKYIKYKGMIDYNKSVETLNNYDAMLFLTYYKNEGFAGTILDALYAGLPVIATNWNSNFEILEDKKTGLSVEIKNPEQVSNKIIELYNNKKLLEQMKKNCLKESEKYTPDKTMKKFIDIIERKKEIK